MSATLPNSNLARSASDVLWSRGGGSLRRLLWKELSEVAGTCGIFALGIVIAALWAHWEWGNRKEMFSLPIIVIQISMRIFPVLVGARAFAREMESGTWELLRSAGASAWDVWLSKLLVASFSSLAISMLSGMAIALAHSREASSYFLGSIASWLDFRQLLVLTVSMQCSLWLRRGWLAMLVSTVLAVPLVYLTNSLVPGWLQRRWSGLPYSESVGLLMLGDMVLGAVVASVVVSLWTIQLRRLRRELLDHSAINDSRRWWQVFRRMAWKEQLAVRDFWLAVLGILVTLDVIAALVFRDPTTRDGFIVALGVMMPLLHSLGCGAIAFALEREDGTQDWLRRISAPASAVFAAKLLVSQASIMSLTSLILFGTQAVVAPANRLVSDGRVALLLVATLNGVVSLGISLLTRRVLPAMFLAVVGVVAVDWLWLRSVNESAAANLASPVWIFTFAILWWLLIGVLLLAIEWRLADRWLNERPWWPRRWRGETPRVTRSSWYESWFDWSSSPEKKAFGRLLWREWMEAKGWRWVAPMVFAPAILFNILEGTHRAGQPQSWLIEFLLIPTCNLLIIGLCVLPALMGVWAFHHDQRQGLFRFLADRGGSPQRIWWSKQAVWLTLVLVLAGLAGAITELQSIPFTWHQRHRGLLTGLALIFALQSYAAGQAISQWSRSALIAMFLAGVLSLLLGSWMELLAQVVHAPWPYQLGAAAILFFASWRSSRDWLEERWTWRAWQRVVLSLVLPATALVLVLELHGYHVCRTIRTFVIPH